jgi:PAS domain S-box-containing protein
VFSRSRGEVPRLISRVLRFFNGSFSREELQVSERRFSIAFEHSPIGMALALPNGQYTKVNRALCDMVGYTGAELLAKSFWDLTHPEDRAIEREFVQSMLNGAIPPHRSREKRYVCKSGRILTVALEISLVRDRHGHPLHFITQIQDITEKRRTEESIRTIVEGVRASSSADFFHSLAIQLCHATGAVHAIIAELVEGEESKLHSLGRCIDRTLAENVTYVLAGTPAEQVVRGGISCSHLSGVAELFPGAPLLHHTTVQGYVGVPLFDSQKRVVGIIAAVFREAIQDPRFVESVLQVFSHLAASEIVRSRVEADLQRAQECFSKAFQSNPAGCAIARLEDGLFVDANEVFLGMTGYERSEVIGTSAFALHIWNDPEERSRLMKNLIENGRVREEPVRLKSKTGRLLDVRFSAEVIQLQGVPCLLGLARDVTEQNALEEEYRQAQKMEAMGRMAGGVAHDFNNLVGVIIVYSELLLKSAALDPVMHKRAEAIHQAAQRAASLTTQLLAFSRKQALDFRIVNLNRIVSETEGMLRRLIREDVSLEVIRCSELGYVKADSGQIAQVIMNLAINARDAMPAGGTLVIETANQEIPEGMQSPVPPGSYVKVTVRDSGMGMDQQTQAHIFEPFFTTKPPGLGTGLGLATVYGIVKQSGGAILVDSRVGAGTTFEVFFPRVDVVAPISISDQPPRIEFPEASPTILVLEDELALRGAIDESLQAEGYTVLVAESGDEALQVARQHPGPIHLLITDVIMPAMSGPEFVQLLTGIRPETQVLYISGYVTDRLTCYPELDPSAILLQKPFKLLDLVQNVRRVLLQAPPRHVLKEGA